MQFIIFVIDSQEARASAKEMADIDIFNELLQSRGYWVSAAGIGSPKSAKVIDNRSEAGIQINHSLFQTPEFYSGFWIIDVPNDEIAIELAHYGSRACNRKVELRPFLK